MCTIIAFGWGSMLLFIADHALGLFIMHVIRPIVPVFMEIISVFIMVGDNPHLSGILPSNYGSQPFLASWRRRFSYHREVTQGWWKLAQEEKARARKIGSYFVPTCCLRGWQNAPKFWQWLMKIFSSSSATLVIICASKALVYVFARSEVIYTAGHSHLAEITTVHRWRG